MSLRLVTPEQTAARAAVDRYGATEKGKVNRRLQLSRRRDRIRVLLAEAKAGGCVDCRRTDLPIEVLDFDHVHGQPEIRLAQATQYGIGRVQRELAKCEVRCPTCHALRHWRARQNSYGRNEAAHIGG
jgi:integrase